MGKIPILTNEQKIILDEISQNEFFHSHFYFTGGTALSAFYLNHRDSEDIDMFSREKFDGENILTFMQEWSRKYNFTFSARFPEVVYRFDLLFPNDIALKVDFGYYPYKQIEEPKTNNGLRVDSLVDIAVNKLLTISQRNNVKDFVDLYFLLPKFSLWDLREGVKMKFNMEIEPLLIAADFLKVEDFTFLPNMVTPLTLDKLKSFFREEAKKLGKTSVE